MDDTQPRVSRAIWLREQERYDEVFPLLREAVATGEEEAPRLLAVTLMQTNQLRAAGQVLKEAVESGRTDLADFLGDVAATLGDVVLADAAYQKAITSGDPKALNNYGDFLSDQERYPEAIEMFRKAIDRNDTLAPGNLVLLYAEDLEDLDTALELGQRHLDESKPMTYSALATVYELLARPDEAEVLHQKAISLGAERAHLKYGWFLRDIREDLVGAEREFQLAADDDEPGWGINLGSILLDLGREGEARAILKHAASWGDLDAQELLDELGEDPAPES